MAMVWLNKGDCESGTLPKICLRCGRATTRTVLKDFSGKLPPLAPEMALAGGSEEKSRLRVPICERHEGWWERRFLLLIGGGLFLIFVPLVLRFWEDRISGILSVIFLGMGFVFACGGALGYLFLGPMVLEAVDSYSQGIIVTGVHEAFARAYAGTPSNREVALFDPDVTERWEGGRQRFVEHESRVHPRENETGEG